MSEIYSPNYKKQNNIPSFYDEQIEKLDWKIIDPEIEKLKLKREILRMELKLQNWNNLEYQNNIEELNNRPDFDIKWWYIEKKVYSLKHNWGLKFSKKKKNKHYRLWYNEIIPSNEWKNRFIIKLNTLDQRIKKIIPIEYNWGRTINVFDNKWRYSETVQIKLKNNNRRNPTGYVEIDMYNWKIVLILDWSKKQQNYHNKKNKSYIHH